ncbi:TPA: hypothetical protein NDT77_004019 [Klebsiella pneumoniae]|nr:hypothetical protein NE241_20230 [Klebsiella pneumoniae]USC58500.1 hypothetical protein NE241_12885 [Klebsiella pneumoniae]HCD6206288.1 hypothetical protein [Klebsiella pneumoniae]
MKNNNNTLSSQLKRDDLLARKVADLIREGLTEEELDSLVRGQSMWLVMQMICSPSGAAYCVSQSSVN